MGGSLTLDGSRGSALSPPMRRGCQVQVPRGRVSVNLLLHSLLGPRQLDPLGASLLFLGDVSRSALSDVGFLSVY